MKQIAVFLFLAIVFSSCKKEDTSLFTIPVTNLRFEVNPTYNEFNSPDIPINNVNFNALALLDAQGIDTSGINSIRPRLARIYLPFGDNNLDFIKEIAVRICLPGDNRPSCGQEVFWYDEDFENKKGAEHQLFGSNVDDIREFVLTNNVNIQVQLTRLWRRPDATFDIFLDMEFDIR
ncbi:MAG TPA: hypothetical protein ENJ95_14350 [Bacteroidetes bacterium]|nr:hypothetical protein [Bacteroidota bacterium]